MNLLDEAGQQEFIALIKRYTDHRCRDTERKLEAYKGNEHDVKRGWEALGQIGKQSYDTEIRGDHFMIQGHPVHPLVFASWLRLDRERAELNATIRALRVELAHTHARPDNKP